MFGIMSPDTEDPSKWDDTIKITDEMPSPRLIKTHLSVDMLPKQMKTKRPKVLISFLKILFLNLWIIYF